MMAKKVEADFREVAAFITLFTPYRAGYAYKYKDKDKYWTTSRGFLTDKLIQVAIDGKAVIGFKAMYRSAVLGLDVDDHEHGGWIKGRASGRSVGEMTPALRDRVQRVKDAMGLEPSMMVRSSRGMHLFWFWIAPEFLSVATAIAKDRLKNAGDEGSGWERRVATFTGLCTWLSSFSPWDSRNRAPTARRHSFPLHMYSRKRTYFRRRTPIILPATSNPHALAPFPVFLDQNGFIGH